MKTERTYKLVIPPQLGISVETMRTILNLEGYYAQLDESAANCEIKYHTLRFAQKAEHYLKQRFECKVCDDTNIIIKCYTFKEHGKWNSEENVLISKSTPNWDIHTEVEKARRSPNLTYYGTYPNNVPFIVFPRKERVEFEDTQKTTDDLQHQIYGIQDKLNTLRVDLQSIRKKIKYEDC